MACVLTPSAYLLPKRWALAVADALSVVMLGATAAGRDLYCETRDSFGTGRLESLRLTRRRLALPFRAFVVLKRVLNRRDTPDSWRIVEKNADAVRTLAASGQSYIIATAHFTREAVLGLLSPAITPGYFVHVAAPPPPRVQSLHDLRMRIQYGTLLKAFSAAWKRTVELAYIGPDNPVPTVQLYKRLREPGTVVCMNVDAPWSWRKSRGSFRRPFAGRRSRECAVGAAALARLADCPVVSCLFGTAPDGTIELEWGTPIHHVTDEIATMNALLDTMERAVGERPSQYILHIGCERRWNAGRKRWEELPPTIPEVVPDEILEPCSSELASVNDASRV
jgi:lauroyl/myristoyl acyltransferase